MCCLIEAGKLKVCHTNVTKSIVDVQADAGQQGCAFLCGSVCSHAAPVCLWRCVLLCLVRVTIVSIISSGFVTAC